MIKILFKALFAFSILVIMAFVTKTQVPKSGPDFLQLESRWVDSVLIH